MLAEEGGSSSKFVRPVHFRSNSVAPREFVSPLEENNRITQRPLRPPFLSVVNVRKWTSASGQTESSKEIRRSRAVYHSVPWFLLPRRNRDGKTRGPSQRLA